MDSVKVMKEASSGAGPTPQMQTKPLKSKKSGDENSKTKAEDNNHRHKMPSKSAEGQDELQTDADRVADDFIEKVNLKSEHCFNGLISNNNTPSKHDSFSLIEDERLLKENVVSSKTSPYKCLNVGEVEVDCYDYETQEVLDINPSESASTSLCKKDSLTSTESEVEEEITYSSYESELQMPDIMRLIQKDLSEPYSIYTYRYFIHNWPSLCFLARTKSECVGAIVCKLDLHRKVVRRGYIAMLAVDEKHRKRGIGSNLVLKAIAAMVADDADEVVLETEITNQPALRLYENLGFVRDKRLFRYYLNGVDALRLKLWLR